ncbi:MAG: DsbA family protein [Sporichthyaceae bacterium]|nr:DsbA family protein [Sporichthyaceae bacterium]
MAKSRPGRGRSHRNSARTDSRSGGRTATQTARREKVAAMQAAERRKAQRNRVIVAVALLAGIIGLVLLIQTQRDKIDTSAARPAGVADAAGGISVGAPAGSGQPVIEIYEDFACPHCKDLEATLAPTLHELADTGAATVIYRPIAILGPGSTKAAAAAGCAQDGGQFRAFHDALFANQQAAAEAGGFSTQMLVDLGRQVGLDSPEFASCVEDQTYQRWGRDATTEASKRGVHTTPTVYLNGERLNLVAGDPNAAAQLRDAIGQPAG